ncbi:hypothetical protein [Nocardioides alkalitolerans]|uniref:hypothetical protein n=1 Tax=Nocardioides alkalitolerans TaxID=281714 RepID=UPI000402C620|nr:hypothetical protein [Nocardioides alkalitolerans]
MTTATKRFLPTRLVSAATASYGVFALAKPSHLPDALEATGADRAGYETLARTYGARDIAVSLVGVTGSRQVGRAALALRIAMDVADCLVLLRATDDDDVRRKVAAVTLGWGALNTAVLVADLRQR